MVGLEDFLRLPSLGLKTVTFQGLQPVPTLEAVSVLSCRKRSAREPILGVNSDDHLGTSPKDWLGVGGCPLPSRKKLCLKILPAPHLLKMVHNPGGDDCILGGEVVPNYAL